MILRPYGYTSLPALGRPRSSATTPPSQAEYFLAGYGGLILEKPDWLVVDSGRLYLENFLHLVKCDGVLIGIGVRWFKVLRL